MCNVVPGGLYRHFKGNQYRVLYVATHSETMEPYVVYQALNGERGIWVRPLKMFVEDVERDGRVQPRFALISEENGQNEG